MKKVIAVILLGGLLFYGASVGSMAVTAREGEFAYGQFEDFETENRIPMSIPTTLVMFTSGLVGLMAINRKGKR